jgi:hypothetical protein
MNELTNDYIPLDVPNTTYEQPKAEGTLPTTVHPFLVPILTKLAKAKPNWKFVGTRRAFAFASDSTKRWANNFMVYENGQHLGSLWRDYNNAGDTIGINCERLDNKRLRGRATFTKDTVKAFKLVIGNFGLPTPEELVVEGRSKANSVVATCFSRSFHSSRSTMNVVEGVVFDFVSEQKAELAAFAGAANLPIGATLLSDMWDARAKHGEIVYINRCWADHTATLVIRYDDGYLLQSTSTDNAPVTKVTSEQLTPETRTALGMLKLVEVGKYIAGMGVRVSVDTFVVVPPPGQEEKTDEQ